jgi:hypothetical protein
MIGRRGFLAPGHRAGGEAEHEKVGSVVIDCNDVDWMVEFWAETLGYVPREPAEDGWVVLSGPEGTNVNVSPQRVPE